MELHYDDSCSTKSGTIIWTILQAGVTDQISILPVAQQSNTVGDNVTLLIQAHSSLLLPLQLSVQGLPPGLTLAYTRDYYFNGYIPVYISGTLPAAAALTSPYQVTVTANDGLYSASTNFQWQVVPPQPPALPSDFDGNNTVDQTDYGVWRGNFGQSVTPFTFSDGNGDGQVDTADWVVWRDHLGQTLGGGTATAIAPQEPTSIAAPLALTSTMIPASPSSSKMLAVSPAVNEWRVTVFEEFESTLRQRALPAPKHSPRSPLTGPSQLFLKDNLLMMKDSPTRLRLHRWILESDAARFCDESSEDVGVVDQAVEELSLVGVSRHLFF